jgi:hypothetical protein
MEAERPELERRLQRVFDADNFTVRRMPNEHAGGKWQLRYAGAQGQGGNLEVDLNYMHRVTKRTQSGERRQGSCVVPARPSL